MALQRRVCSHKESATKKEGEDSESEGALNHPISVEHINVDAKRLGSLVALILKETISTIQAKKLHNEDMTSLPLDIAEQNGWKLISDPDKLNTLFTRDGILNGKNSSKQFEQYNQGGKNDRKMTIFFTRKIMAESRGNVRPELMGKA